VLLQLVSSFIFFRIANFLGIGMPKNSAVDLWWPPLFEGAYDATF